MRSRRILRRCLSALPWAALTVAFGANGVDAASGEKRTAGRPIPDVVLVGITAPSMHARLASIPRGRLAGIAVEEGKSVRKGEIVFSLDDRVQRARMEIARARAESGLQVDLARARKEKARRELERLEKLYGDASASSKELSDARAQADIAGIEYEVALFDHEQDTRVYTQEKALLERFYVRAPFSGYVAEHLKQVGETVEDGEGVVVVARLDPLEVSVDCPLSLAPWVIEGDRIWVRPVEPGWEPKLGTITLASRVADGASQTFRVKLSVENEDGIWVSGLKVAVEFSNSYALRGTEGVPIDRGAGVDQGRRHRSGERTAGVE